ncbi:Aspartic proteinase nepenthesin-1 [Nymphaea thermarum]|nr:Aspartic proteinase nepenthesin-1 [Nymphaea thermarum]
MDKGPDVSVKLSNSECLRVTSWMQSIQRMYLSPNSVLNKARTQELNKQRSNARVAFIKEIGKPLVNTTSLDMDTCFQGLPDSISIPTLTFHFEGGDLQVPAENYIAVDSVKQLSCLAILGNCKMFMGLLIYRSLK